MTDLRDRSVLVLGATGGLGSRISRVLAGRGALLTVSARHRDRLAALELPGAEAVAGDLRLPGEPDRLVAAAVAAHGRLDGVVYAAGAVAFGGLAATDDEVLDDLLLLNYLGPVRCYRAALPHLGAGGFLATVSAVTAERPTAGMAAYSASKAAMTAFDTALAHELRRSGVHVLDARPPHTETGLAGRPLAGEAPRLPPGKHPDDVAERIVAGLEKEERELPSSAF